MIGFMLAAVMAPPHAPPVDYRLTVLENKAATQAKWNDEANTRIERLEKAAGVKATTPCPCTTNQGPKCSCEGDNCPCRNPRSVAVAPAPASVPASDFTNPTFHYSPPANFKVESGAVVLDRHPSHVSYPGGPMQALQQATAPVVQPQPTFYSAPPVFYAPQPMMMRGGPMRGFFRGGANCSGSS